MGWEKAETYCGGAAENSVGELDGHHFEIGLVVILTEPGVSDWDAIRGGRVEQLTQRLF